MPGKKGLANACIRDRDGGGKSFKKARYRSAVAAMPRFVKGRRVKGGGQGEEKLQTGSNSISLAWFGKEGRHKYDKKDFRKTQ